MGQMGREKRLVIIQLLTFYRNLNIYKFGNFKVLFGPKNVCGIVVGLLVLSSPICSRNGLRAITSRLYLWCRHFQQCFSYIVAISFIGGNRSTRSKPPT
jgi:hypothetical protein